MFDNLIALATNESPITLAAFLFEVDRRQRIVPSLDEARNMIDSLFYEGKLIELAPGRYIKNPNPKEVPAYTRVDEMLYEAARNEMHQWHVTARQRLV
jgi:hypothetical protein